MLSKKILITGATSIIAESLLRYFKSETDHELLLLSEKKKFKSSYDNITHFYAEDLDKKRAKEICLENKPDVIINTISLEDPAICEKEKRQAWEYNVYVVENLARVAKILDAHLITFSGDSIFDGSKGPYTEDTRPNPMNYLGRSLLAGENMCKSGCDMFTIFRLSSLYGYSSYRKPNMVKTFLNAAEAGDECRVITGNYTNPVFSDDVARAVNKAIEKNRYGTYNLGGADYLNNYEIAMKTAAIFGHFDHKFRPMAPALSHDFHDIPQKAGLVTLKAETDLGIKFSGIESGLQVLKFQIESNRIINK